MASYRATGEEGRDMAEVNDLINSSEDTDSIVKQSDEVRASPQRRLPNEFSTKSWKEDFTLIVEGSELYVSSSILAMVSPVFSSMFENTVMKGDCKQLELPWSYADVVEFLRCVYPTIKKPITKQNAAKVAPLAKKYQVESVMGNCEEVLSLMCGPSLESICTVLMCASACEMSVLRQKCMAALMPREDSELDDALKNRWISKTIRKEIESTRFSALKEKLDEKTLACKIYETVLKKSDSRREYVEQRMVHLKVSATGQTTSTQIDIRSLTYALGLKIDNAAYYGPTLIVYLSAKACNPDWKSFQIVVKLICTISNGNERLVIDKVRDLRSDNNTARMEMKIDVKGILKTYLDVSLILLVGNKTVQLKET